MRALRRSNSRRVLERTWLLHLRNQVLRSMIHLEKYHLTDIAPKVITIAWCGKRATLDANDKISPKDYNFVTREWPSNVTCLGCIGEYKARRQ